VGDSARLLLAKDAIIDEFKEDPFVYNPNEATMIEIKVSKPS